WRCGCRLVRAVICPDGQLAHGRHAKIARRVTMSQAAALASSGKSVAPFRPSRARSRGALRGRHERWVRDAVDAVATQDERCQGGRKKACGPGTPTLVSSWRE